MIKPIVVWRHMVQADATDLSRVVLSLYGWLYKISRRTNTRAENSKNVGLVPAGYQSSAPQFDSRELFVFSSCFRNLCWEAAGHKISDPS